MTLEGINKTSINAKKAAQVIGDQIFDATGRAAIDFDDYLENRSLGLILGSYYNLASVLDGNPSEGQNLNSLLDLDRKQFEKLLREIQTRLRAASGKLSPDVEKAFIERLAKDLCSICKIGSSPESHLEFSAICDDMTSFLSDLLTAKEVGFNEPTREIGLSLESSLHENDTPNPLASYQSLAKQLLSVNSAKGQEAL